MAGPIDQRLAAKMAAVRAPAGPPAGPDAGAMPPEAGGGGDALGQLQQLLQQALMLVMQSWPEMLAPGGLQLLRGFFGQVDKLIAPARQQAGQMGQAGPARPPMGAPAGPQPGMMAR